MRSNSIRYIGSAIFVWLLFFVVSPSFDQTKAQLEKQKAQLEVEIKRLNNELSAAKKNTRLTTAQLTALNKKISERTKLINNINSQMSILDQQIGQTNDSIVIMRRKVDSLKTEYAKVIRVLYREHGNVDKMVLLFDTPSYNKSYLRLKFFNEYSRYRRHQAKYIAEREEQLHTVTLRLQRQKDEKNALLAQEKRNKEELTKEQQQKQKSVNAAKAQQNQLTAQLSKKEKQKRDLDKQIKRIIAEEVRKAAQAAKVAKASSGTSSSSSSTSTAKPSTATVAASTEFAGNKGRLSWPVYYKSVLREYGRYTHASGGENVNNGIDLATSPGAQVSAVFAGIVTRVFTCPNGAQGVIVRHGEYVTVYANLATVSVRQGAKVNARQALGTVATAESGQGEFSFQIWKGTTPQNPRGWLK